MKSTIPDAERRTSNVSRESGFTLIELLVVMIVIGILAAIAIPLYINQQRKAWDSALKSDIRSAANEMNTWYVDHQCYSDVYWGGNIVSPGSTDYNCISLNPGSRFAWIDVWGTHTIGGPSNADVIPLSDGTTLNLVAAGQKGFCMSIWSTHNSDNYYYDSLTGGLKASGACTVGSSVY